MKNLTFRMLSAALAILGFRRVYLSFLSTGVAAYAEPAARAVQASMAVKIFIFSWFYVFEKQGFYELWACRDIW